MRLKYETAIATMIQFVALTLLNVGTGTVSVVTSCHENGGQCVSNLLVSLIFFILLALWFACIWVLGYAAQQRRSKRLAQLLIAVEIMVAVVALFNAKHHTDPLSLATSLIDLCLAAWVIVLAFRLMRAGGGRIVTRQHGRKRPNGSAPGPTLT
jgi:hypothetical protein